MMIRERIWEKECCYATEEVRNCSYSNCLLYYTCSMYKNRLDNHEFSSREEILDIEVNN